VRVRIQNVKLCNWLHKHSFEQSTYEIVALYTAENSLHIELIELQDKTSYSIIQGCRYNNADNNNTTQTE
jgi:hypothetical protein